MLHDFSLTVFGQRVYCLGESGLVGLDVLSVVEFLNEEFGGLDSLGGDDLSDEFAGGRVDDNFLGVNEVG